MTTPNDIYRAIFPPDGQAVPVSVARNWPAVEAAAQQLAAALNGEQSTAAPTQARTPEWFAARNERILRIAAENPDAPRREIARLAKVSVGVVNNLAKNQNRALANEAYAVMSGEEPTIRNSRIVEKPEEVPTQTDASLVEKSPQSAEQEPKNAEILQKTASDKPKQPDRAANPEIRISEKIANDGKAPLKIPHEHDEWIWQQTLNGSPRKDILVALQSRCQQCTYADLAYRIKWLGDKHSNKKPHNTPTRSEEVQCNRIAAAPLSKVDVAILEMANKYALPSEICIAIDRNFGESITTGEMAERIRRLRGEL